MAFQVLLCLLFVNIAFCNTEHNVENLVVLEKDNTVVLRGQVNDKSATEVIRKMQSVVEKDIYLYLLTPGGSIVAGNSIIQTIRALSLSGKNIVCIADNAYSMGFVIFQACPTRYVMDNSIIMQHQASLSVSGPIEQAANRFDLVKKLEKQSNNMQASRLNMTQTEFHSHYVHDWWLYGSEIVEMNAGDKVVNVVCKDTSSTYHEIIHTWFGSFDFELYECPLLHAAKNITEARNSTLIADRIASESQKIMNYYDASNFNNVHEMIYFE